MDYIPRLKTKYAAEIAPALKEQFGYKSTMEIPRLLKISVNQGLGQAITDKKMIDQGIEEMSAITGQRAVSTKSKKDISNFKLRKGMPVGVRVTLRGEKMYEFLDRLVSVAIPVSVISGGLTIKDSMEEETIHSEFPSKSFFLKSISTK